ncbi:MAG: ROK family transcriptional regulator [Fuerstiella sp.]
MASSHIQPGLLRKMTVRRILETLQQQGPLSRADLTRETGISAPTVSKAVVDLLESGLLEEGEAPDNALGRPGKRLQLARSRAQVVGVVLDVQSCRVVSASLDGEINEEHVKTFAPPANYETLIDILSRTVEDLVKQTTSILLGIGISSPGLVDEENELCLLSPNLQVTNQHSPAKDLAAIFDVPTICMQESRALCLAERLYGKARGLDDFAMMDVSTGLGLGVFIGGELLRGQSGLAGELGHLTVDPTGKLCGCGNHGCLETLATDSALATMVAEKSGKKLSIDEVVRQLRAGELQAPEELNRVCEYLAIGMSAAINLFNPSTLFVHGRFLEISDSMLAQVIRMTRRRTLDPSFERCTIEMAITTKDQAAIAAIVHHLTTAAGPRVGN